MGVAVVGHAFEDNIKNGGIGLKMLFHRAQSVKVTQRLIKNKAGTVLRKKGCVHHVDCNATGSNEGTSKDPKFSLLQCFKHAVFPEIEALTRNGAKSFGHSPVVQGDNHRPHDDGTFKKFVEGHCLSNGWLWEPQASQMPHVSVLDLSAFLAMPRRHSHLARSLHGTRVLKEDEV